MNKIKVFLRNFFTVTFLFVVFVESSIFVILFGIRLISKNTLMTWFENDYIMKIIITVTLLLGFPFVFIEILSPSKNKTLEQFLNRDNNGDNNT